MVLSRIIIIKTFAMKEQPIERDFITHSFHFCKAIFSDIGVSKVISTASTYIKRTVIRPLSSVASFVQSKWSETALSPVIDPTILHTFNGVERSKWTLPNPEVNKDKQYGHTLGRWPESSKGQSVNISEETLRLEPLLESGSEALFPIQQKEIKPFDPKASRKANLVDTYHYVTELKKDLPFATELCAVA